MSPKNYYTLPEITFCTFIARFGRSHFDESDIHNLSGRSLSSIKMKVQNIASMLHEAGYPTSNSVSRLTGKPAGEGGRKTNWDDVISLNVFDKTELLNKCKSIGIKTHS